MLIALHYLQVFLTYKLSTDQVFEDRFKLIANWQLYIAAILVSASASLAATAWVFFLFLGGHAFWLFVGLAMQDKRIIQLHSFFIPINLWAIGIRLIS